jgi:hypothetical protein
MSTSQAVGVEDHVEYGSLRFDRLQGTSSFIAGCELQSLRTHQSAICRAARVAGGRPWLTLKRCCGSSPASSAWLCWTAVGGVRF